MGDTLLRLPATVQLANASALWREWESKLRAEAAGVSAQAGREVRLNAAELTAFDSSALSLLLSCARLCRQHGLNLEVHSAPPALRDLARLYGLDVLLWPGAVPA
ncbi:STAS domain-containing protein [Inhella crocodyli]|uniref:STAS domain-containing protein n=1 Tax=Inhella crocodyli TaxID=2499851 RepID=UPI0013E3D997|nr:STAS domain-containing protein [Inhella crocodyli]